MRLAVAMFALLLTTVLAVAKKPAAKTSAASTPPEPAAILDKVGQTYRGFDRYLFRGAMRVQINVQGQNQNVDMPFAIAVSKPGKKRNEISNPMMRLIQVSDGENSWMYVPQFGQYTKTQAAPVREEAPAPAGSIAGGTPVARYLAMSDGLKSGRLVREEAVDFEGKPRACWVIEADYQRSNEAGLQSSPTTFWVEKARHLVLRESTLVSLANPQTGGMMSMNHLTVFETARVNEPLPDSLFTFVPPPDARQVESLAMPGAEPAESELVGTAAAPFSLKNLAGKPMSLASHKGKVVLLDFWASWCGPCRIEMPTIDKLDRELKPKGLVVIGVNVGETAKVASGYVKKNNYGFSILLDPDSQVSELYGASGLPTVVVIDKEGKVSSHFIGVRSEEVLREAIRKAGIE